MLHLNCLLRQKHHSSGNHRKDLLSRHPHAGCGDLHRELQGVLDAVECGKTTEIARIIYQDRQRTESGADGYAQTSDKFGFFCRTHFAIPPLSRSLTSSLPFARIMASLEE